MSGVHSGGGKSESGVLPVCWLVSSKCMLGLCDVDDDHCDVKSDTVNDVCGDTHAHADIHSNGYTQ